MCTFISLSNPILCEIGWLKQYQPDVDLFRTRFRAKGREGESKRNAKRWSADDLQGAQRPKHTSAMATVACVYITAKYTQVQPANASSFFLHFKHSTREIIKWTTKHRTEHSRLNSTNCINNTIHSHAYEPEQTVRWINEAQGTNPCWLMLTWSY